MYVLQLLSEGGGEVSHTEMLWVFYSLMGFFLLVIVAGWLSSLRGKSQPEAKSAHEESVHHHEKPTADAPAKAEELAPKSAKVMKGGRKK